jgi:thermitase
LATTVVADILRGSWTIEPLGRDTRDFLLTPAGPKKTIDISAAWNMVGALKEHRDVQDAEPALVVPGIDPRPDQVYASAGRRAASKRSARSADLTCSRPNDWSLNLCRVREAWNATTEQGRPAYGKGITLGHPDTGYTRHPEIWDPRRLLPQHGYDFEADKPDPRDPLVGANPGHGGSTASVIMSDIGVGAVDASFVSGVAPESRLIPLRVSSGVVHLNFANLTKAIYHAADLTGPATVHVISMSLGGPLNSRALLRAIRYALDRGIILCAAAGNIWPFVVYPAKYDEVIAVAACNCQRKPWSGSAKGRSVDLTAPGESVWRARSEKPSRYTVDRSAGTSYAVTQVAGACALWLAHHGRDALIAKYGAANLAAVFKELLVRQGVTKPTGWNTRRYGTGILDAYKLVTAQLPARAPARGMAVARAGVPARPQSDVDILTDYFPDRDPAATRLALGRVLGVSSRQIDEILVEHADELGFHVAVNPEFRERIERLARTPTGRAMSAASRSRFVLPNMSTKLKKTIKGQVAAG